MSVPGNSLLSERLAVLAVLNPIALSSSSAVSAYVTMAGNTNVPSGSLFQRLLALVQLGDNGTGTVTVSAYKASDTSGTGSAAIYTASFAATNADNRIIELDLNAALGALTDTSKICVAVSASVDAGGCPVSAIILGGDGRYEPASGYNTALTATPATPTGY